MSRPNNPRFPHTCKIVREGPIDPDDYDPLIDEDDYEPTTIYEGECRSSEKNTVSDSGEVVTSQRTLSIPLTNDQWKEREYYPQAGDEVTVDKGTSIEHGRILDFIPGNLGTHIIFKYNRA